MNDARLAPRSTLLGVLDGLRGRVRFDEGGAHPVGSFVFHDSVPAETIYARANRGGSASFQGLMATPDPNVEPLEVEASLHLSRLEREGGRLSVEVRLQQWRPLPPP